MKENGKQTNHYVENTFCINRRSNAAERSIAKIPSQDSHILHHAEQRPYTKGPATLLRGHRSSLSLPSFKRCCSPAPRRRPYHCQHPFSDIDSTVEDLTEQSHPKCILTKGMPSFDYGVPCNFGHCDSNVPILCDRKWPSTRNNWNQTCSVTERASTHQMHAHEVCMKVDPWYHCSTKWVSTTSLMFCWLLFDSHQVRFRIYVHRICHDSCRGILPWHSARMLSCLAISETQRKQNSCEHSTEENQRG